MSQYHRVPRPPTGRTRDSAHARTAAIISALLLVTACATTAAAPDLSIEHVTLVSAELAAPQHDITVRVHEGRISQVTAGKTGAPPRGTQIIDGHGLYLAPGLIDSHVHLGQIPGMTPAQERAHPDLSRAARAQIPRSYLYYGFTTLVDLVSTPQEMAGWRQQPLRPDTYFCGAAPVMDSYPMPNLPKPERYQQMPYFLLEPGMQPPEGIDPAQHTPAAVVKRMKTDGAICVKAAFERGFGGDHDLPVPRLETIRALVEAAHAAGLPVFMHANAAEAQRFALDAKVDIIAHGLWNWPEPLTVTGLTPGMRGLLEAVAAAQVGWQPTVRVLKGLEALFDPTFLADPRLAEVLPSGLIEWYRTPEGQWFRDETEQEMGFPAAMPPEARARQISQIFAAIVNRDVLAVGYLNTHGGHLLFGTDTPSAPTYANPPGLNGWLEMQALSGAGLTAAQIFRAATLGNAQALRLTDVGTIEVGKRANLLLLTEDPTASIEAYPHIVKVILGGAVIDRGSLAVPRRAAEHVAHRG